ncbi:hypothetical protein [Streptomyces sp. NPDC050535]|uniref:hypothetical protein n=1 Tax=Streptomyces sp. NPDC050535 TaxID=3365626 RepID=UPI0037B13995
MDSATPARLKPHALALPRGFPRGRTRPARRTLDELRAQLPVPGWREGLSTDDILFAVALHGVGALNVLAPRLAQDAGLLGGPLSTRTTPGATGPRTGDAMGGGSHGMRKGRLTRWVSRPLTV